MKKIILGLLAAASIIFADDINSAAKNPSMAAYGTQRASSAITALTIPVKTAGAACNVSTDIIAVTSDRSSQLICQSGVWTPVGGAQIGTVWYNMAGQRFLNTNYYNATGKEITVLATVYQPNGSAFRFLIDQGATQQLTISGSIAGQYTIYTVPIPAGCNYQINTYAGSPSLFSWYELR